ncbi:hypothetical protein [Pseudomonas citronellolis]|uniref:hypothetical protein n=1 Tax=Pseudomonas citronellolis TaxID=53408 RepID=UPI000778B6C3|nr:hypothetical protein [Pseudomonas citronellolis]AMO76062.1 hypothetical protein PcP3B5_26270 [Pseudomonas citronellolis]
MSSATQLLSGPSAVDLLSTDIQSGKLHSILFPRVQRPSLASSRPYSLSLSQAVDTITADRYEHDFQPFSSPHLHNFADSLYREQPEDSLLLLVERKDDGGRTFRIVEGTPLAIASGTDLYA